MTLRQFANLAGVRIVRCGAGHGGPIGYTSADFPQCVITGFKTVSEARNHWLVDTFGEQTAKAVRALLDPPK